MRNSIFMLILAAACLAAACAPVVYVGVHVLYRHAELPAAQVEHDIAYLPDGAEVPAHRLDLYRASQPHAPMMVFVHGGGWDSGDKQLRAGGADVYANIGRFYAARGITVAVVNYRLQPVTDWRGQVSDVASAMRWIYDHASAKGTDAGALFLLGHSAGAHLVSYVALDSASHVGISIRGVISVSGAALDLTDAQTYALGEDVRYYAKRFQGDDRSDAWKVAASPAAHITRAAPAFLVMCAGGESKGLQRQAQVLADALTRAGVDVRRLVVKGESHSRMVLVLTRADKAAAPAVLAFVRTASAAAKE
jgi:acetyl esterase/lipase